MLYGRPRGDRGTVGTAARVASGRRRRTGHGRPPGQRPRWWRESRPRWAASRSCVVVGLWVKGQGPQELGSLSGALHSFGRLTALLSLGAAAHPGLPHGAGPVPGAGVRAGRHRADAPLVGFTSFNLLWAHIVLITLGYAAATQLGIWGTLVDFVVQLPGDAAGGGRHRRA